MEQNALLYTIQGVVHALLTKIAYLAVGFRPPHGPLRHCGPDGADGGLYGGLSDFAAQPPGLFLPPPDRPGAVRELGKYALPLVPLSVLSWLNTSVSTLALKHLLGSRRRASSPARWGWPPRSTSSRRASTPTGPPTCWKTTRATTVSASIPCTGSCLHAHALRAGITLLQSPVFLLLGKSYRSSVVFFPFLFLSPICYCLGETTGMGITISKKTYWTTLIYCFPLWPTSLCALCSSRRWASPARPWPRRFGHSHAAPAHRRGRKVLPCNP